MQTQPLPEYWFGPPPSLAEDERWVAHFPANRTQGKRAVGGGLHLTTARLLFSPNAIDARLGGKPWACTRDQVASIGVEPGRFAFRELFSGGLRPRVRIDLAGGGCELFVVARADERAAELRELLDVPAPASEIPTAVVVTDLQR